MGTDELERGTGRATNINRAGRMVLHPLAEIGIGVFVSVRISGSQLMMDILGYRKRSQDQQKKNKADRQPLPRPLGEGAITHRLALSIMS